MAAIKSFGALNFDEKLIHYVESTFKPEDSILAEVRERSARRGLPSIQLGAMDALHLEILTRGAGAKKAVEIGTLGGYSGICITRGMGPSGKLFTFEFNPLHAEVALESFRKAGIAEQVEIFVGPALEKLKLIEKLGPFDFVFIDADKVNYPQYLNWAADHLRVGGVAVADNTFGFGAIADESFKTEEDAASIKALRLYNQNAAQGDRFRSTILPTGEGLTVSVKIR